MTMALKAGSSKNVKLYKSWYGAFNRDPWLPERQEIISLDLLKFSFVIYSCVTACYANFIKHLQNYGREGSTAKR